MLQAPPHAPSEDQLRLAEVRRALESEDPRLVLPARLLAHVLNTALLLVALPLGAFLTVHALRRGANPALSARMVVLTALYLAVAATPEAAALVQQLSDSVIGQDVLRAIQLTRVTGDITALL